MVLHCFTTSVLAFSLSGPILAWKIEVMIYMLLVVLTGALDLGFHQPQD